MDKQKDSKGKDTERRDREIPKTRFVMLTARDLRILEFIGKFGMCNERHLLRLCGFREDAQGGKNIYQVLRRLERGGYITKSKLLFKQPSVIMLTKNGAGLVNVTKARKIPLHTIGHDMLVIDLYQAIITKHPDSEIKSERELKSYYGITPTDKEKIPDLLLNRETAVEIELSEKSNKRLRSIIQGYLMNPTLKKIVYHVKSPSLGWKIHEIGHSDKIGVYIFDQDITKAQELFKSEEMVIKTGFDFSKYG